MKSLETWFGAMRGYGRDGIILFRLFRFFFISSALVAAAPLLPLAGPCLCVSLTILLLLLHLILLLILSVELATEIVALMAHEKIPGHPQMSL